MLRLLISSILLLLMAFPSAQAESPVQDSLRREIHAHPGDPTGIQALIDLSDSYAATNLDSSLAIAYRAKALAQRLEHEEFTAQAENTLGIAWLFKGQNREALESFYASLEIRRRQGNPEKIAKALNNVALTHLEMGEHSEAIDKHLESLKLKEEIGDSNGISISYINIGLIYQRISDLPLARNYYLRALDYAPLGEDTMAYATNLYNIGGCYYNENRFDSASYWFDQSFPLVQAMGDQRMIGLHHLFFGKIDMEYKNHEQAQEKIGMAAQIFEDLGKQDMLAEALSFYGENALAMNRPTEALDYCQRAYRMALETESVNRQENCLRCLHKSHHRLGQNGKAYAYLVKYKDLQDSLATSKIHKKIVRKDMEYAFNKRALADSLERDQSEALVKMEYENEFQRQQSLTLFLIILGVMMLGLAILFYVNYLNKQRLSLVLEERVQERTQTLEEQKDQLAEYAYINAHLMRQPLTQIMGLIPLIQSAKTEEERNQYLLFLQQSSLKLDEVIHDVRDIVEKVDDSEDRASQSDVMEEEASSR